MPFYHILLKFVVSMQKITVDSNNFTYMITLLHTHDNCTRSNLKKCSAKLKYQSANRMVTTNLWDHRSHSSYEYFKRVQSVLLAYCTGAKITMTSFFTDSLKLTNSAGLCRRIFFGCEETARKLRGNREETARKPRGNREEIAVRCAHLRVIVGVFRMEAFYFVKKECHINDAVQQSLI